MSDILKKSKDAALPLIDEKQQASKSLKDQKSNERLLIDENARATSSVKSAADNAGNMLGGVHAGKKTERFSEGREDSLTSGERSSIVKTKAKKGELDLKEQKTLSPSDESPPKRNAKGRQSEFDDKDALNPRTKQSKKADQPDRLNNTDRRLSQSRIDDVVELAESEHKVHTAHRQQSWINKILIDSKQKREAEAASAKSLLTVGSDCYSKPLDASSGSRVLGAAGVAVTATSTVLRSSKDSDEDEGSSGGAAGLIPALKGKKANGRSGDAAGRSGKRGVKRSESRAGGSLARQTPDSVAKPATKEAAAQAASAAAKLRNAAIKAVKDLIAFLSATLSSTIGPLLIGVVMILITVVLLLSVFTSVTETPYGLFFVTESEQEMEMSDAISKLTNSYYSKFYSILMDEDYDDLSATCAITDSDEAWKTILALYAVETCKEGKSPAVMDKEHYEILEKVFWEYIHIKFHTKVTYDEYTENDSGEDEATTTETSFDEFGNEIEITVPSVPETTIVEFKTLEISITTSSKEDVSDKLNFTEEEKAAVEELLQESDQTWSSLSDLFKNLIISVDGAFGAFDVTAYADVAETVFRACVEAGYSVEAACGILGNIQQESSFNPLDLNKKSGAFGLVQWLGGRLTALKKLSDYTSGATQAGFLLYELNKYTSWWTTYGGEVHHTYNGKKITSLSSFKDCNDPAAAAGAFCIVFERPGEFPGDGPYENRCKYAQSWYDYAQTHWLNSSGASGTAGDILNTCQKLANIVYDDDNWHYHTTRYGSFSAARKGSRKMDCAKYVSYVLQDIGILSPGQTFYTNSRGHIKCKGKNTLKALKSKCQIIPVGKKVKDCAGILQPGDICCMTTHTCIYSDSKGGDMYWWSAGTGACKNKKFKYLYKHYPGYQSRGGKKGQTIHYIIRAKG